MFSSTELVSRASSQDVRPVAGRRGRGKLWQGLQLGAGGTVEGGCIWGQAVSVQGLEQESNLVLPYKALGQPLVWFPWFTFGRMLD